jgi:hypothetical protein
LNSILLRTAVPFLFAFPAASQNLLQNGDFSQQLARWTVRGTATSVQPSDAVLVGLRRAERAELVQTVPLLPAYVHELTFDVAVEGPRSNGGPMPEVAVLVQSAEVGSFRVNGVQWDYTRITWRTRVAIRIPAQTGGPVEFALQLRNEASDPRAGATSFYLDDVILAPVFDPITVIAGDRVPGGTVQLRLLGKPGATGAPLLAAAPLPLPITIPGIQGTWNLDFATLVLAGSGTVPNDGELSFVLGIPADPNLIGGRFWLQGLQVDPASGASAGPAHAFPIHP